ncbi:MAG: hypothetical protein HN567_04070 [Actinobacteria bacterium]|jgi:beta-mannosidase|nr:hypothetical protein [Actinomycetota bacterium]MBT3745514.1 hypothetical protein [Actinomycetota bacterium]MBT3969499.1 hypothetical protein [Actinomycetota bacterium]MBT4010121.1 hypothetical protein [Actinomycetota bacterium]MBT4302650.1 hypothetical protein [Actinomycetota bacterium]
MELTGPWLAQTASDARRRSFPLNDLDESDWTELPVPGQWRFTKEFADQNGPLLYRTHFNAPAPTSQQRSWLEIGGIFSQGDIWLDGSYLQATEGYFFSHNIEITDALKTQNEHLLAIEVTSPPQAPTGQQRTLTGTTQQNGNPGGIWQPISIRQTGPISLLQQRIICTDANPTVATLAIRVIVDADQPQLAVFHTTILGIDHRHQQPLAAGQNTVEWSIRIPHPPLWWPHELGDQPLHQITLAVTDQHGTPNDQTTRHIGFRSIHMHHHQWRINNQTLFLRGANLGPLNDDLTAITEKQAQQVVTQALEANLNLLRLAGHIAHPALYTACDQAGLLLWQDMPLHGEYHRSIRSQATHQAREMVNLLGHHPSIIVWCAHDTPDAPDPTKAAPRLLDHQKPTWSRAVLDRSIRREIQRKDPSRPALSQSGMLPNLANYQEANSHLWFGWHDGQAADLGHYLDHRPAAGRFVSAFGSHSVPDQLTPNKNTWPTLDPTRLNPDHDQQLDVLLRRFPPESFTDPATWVTATQQHQADLLKTQIETLRRRKYRPVGGFTLDQLTTTQPATNSSILDHQNQPKPAYLAVTAACQPTLIMANPLQTTYASGQTLATNITAVHDGPQPLGLARITAHLTYNQQTHTTVWEGHIDADQAIHIGQIAQKLTGPPGPIELKLQLTTEQLTTTNHYQSNIAA